ncbi:glycosyltransferase family 69 protein [Emericellopsis cladophorae]|uniref:Glycosyltransferase family 69 protein n=1 Tax=Emericellopsis cladophorae TaxID=2686198 RepID=A0A9P9Y8V2_9HYPO|nr:glycosyltransferase family 69 protein [Emericellopsis cladophorae]KAI6785606.1 glycosyltransferase family 69 protein [Emericellopsis cladophorae]
MLIRPVRLRRLPLLRIITPLLTLLLLDALLLVASRPAAPASSSSPVSPRHTAEHGSEIFIASIHRDSAPRLHASWSDALLRLVEAIAQDSAVHVSIAEAYSSDGTRNELRQLQLGLERLGASNTFTHGMTGHELATLVDNPPVPRNMQGGWLWLDEERRWAFRETPLLASLRNEALAPLRRLREEEGRTFDRILWVDDHVTFEPEDVVELLNTRGGNYTTACATTLDPSSRLAEVTAIRDDQGHPILSSRWPWFLSLTSRAAAQKGVPVAVRSCWGGLVAMDAAPIYDDDASLAFRAIDDALADRRIEADETCLLQVDSAGDRGVWMNPGVRVTRTPEEYHRVKCGRVPWQSAVLGSWANRLGRWFGAAAVDSDLRSRVQAWSRGVPGGSPNRYEPGVHCLFDGTRVVRRKPVLRLPWQP